MNRKLKKITILAVLITGLAILPSLFLPIWKITLDAPQYPDGLEMTIWRNDIKGDVANINLMNHYVGMANIEKENFPELQFLTYLIIAMVVLAVAVFLIKRRFMLWIYVLYMVACGTWGVYDFWKWEYEYGHNLNPHAAINIPGMAYQPPLLGYKQLLNFLAGSFPDIGAILIILAGGVAIGGLMLEYWKNKKVQY